MARDAFQAQQLRLYFWRRFVTARMPNSTCSTVARIDAINITEVRDKAEGNNANPQSDWPVVGYPDDELWECRDEALTLINTMRQCWPTSLASCFMRRYWINKQNGVKYLTARARRFIAVIRACSCGSRDRGQSMVDLLSQYETVGLQLNCRELPDHLPLYLEYLSVLPESGSARGITEYCPYSGATGRSSRGSSGTVVSTV